MYYKEIYTETKNRKILEKMERMKIPEWIQQYINDYLVSADTKELYLGTIKQFINWCIECQIIKAPNLSEISAEQMNCVIKPNVIEYRKHLIEKNLNFRTIKMNFNILSSFWNYLLDLRVVSENVFKNLPKDGRKNYKKNIDKVPKTIDIDGMRNRIEKKSDEFLKVRNLTIVDVLRYTGLRKSELVALNLDDIDFDNNKLYILGKGLYHKEDVDVIDLFPEAKAALLKWIEFTKKYRQDDSFGEGERAVFIDKKNKRISESVINNLFRRYSNGNISPHMMRHMYCTLLYNEGCNLVYIKQQMRHAQSITEMYSDGGAEIREYKQL